MKAPSQSPHFQALAECATASLPAFLKSIHPDYAAVTNPQRISLHVQSRFAVFGGVLTNCNGENCGCVPSRFTGGINFRKSGVLYGAAGTYDRRSDSSTCETYKEMLPTIRKAFYNGTDPLRRVAPEVVSSAGLECASAFMLSRYLHENRHPDPDTDLPGLVGKLASSLQLTKKRLYMLGLGHVHEVYGKRRETIAGSKEFALFTEGLAWNWLLGHESRLKFGWKSPRLLHLPERYFEGALVKDFRRHLIREREAHLPTDEVLHGCLKVEKPSTGADREGSPTNNNVAPARRTRISEGPSDGEDGLSDASFDPVPEERLFVDFLYRSKCAKKSQRVIDALERLKQDPRLKKGCVYLHLKYWHEMSYMDIAGECLGERSKQAAEKVSRRVAKVRDALRDELQNWSDA